MSEDSRASDALWEFALALYSSPGVEETVLTLQDEHGANVVILLWACWLESRGQVLDAHSLQRAERAVADWDCQMVRALRQLRRHLKDLAEEDEIAGELRARIKEAELLAERRSLALLSPIAGCRKQAIAPGDNARFYLQSLGAGQVADELEPLLASLSNQDR